MSRRRGGFWGALALLVLVAAVGFYFYATEPVRYMAPAAPDATVRGNPYLAAQTLLEDWQRPTRRVFSTAALFPLPATDTTLILDQYRGELGSDRIAALFDWTHRGGHLIVAARPAYHYLTEDADKERENRPEGNSDPLLTPFGIRAVTVTPESDDDPFTTLLDRFQPMESLFLEYCLGNDTSGDDLPPQCEALTCEAPPLPAPASVRGQNGEHWRLLAAPGQTLRQGAAQALADPPHRIATNNQGAQLIQLTLGEGRMTVLAGLTLWDNDNLHYFDHAWLLKQLTGDGPVWFVQGIDMPPLPLWLWEHAWPPILALLLALSAWLWRSLTRPGPRWQALESGRADYLAHLLALGHFHWRTGQSNAFLAPLRDTARRRLELLHPDQEQALSIAAERLAIPETTLRDALDATVKERARDRQQWTDRVAVLQTIRSRL